jgi:uncharacterized protein (TIGR04255 family)
LTELAGKRLHFKNPPIIEAVIAFTVALLPESSVPRFERSSDRMNAIGYRSAGNVTQHSFQLTLTQGVSAAGSEDTRIGVRFNSEDSLHAVQFNRNGFVFSRLGRYDCWEQLRDEARKLWEVYLEAAEGPKVVLAGVRYLNKLFIPTNEEPEEFVRAYPQIPKHIAPTIYQSFMRTVSTIVDPPGSFIHNQVLLPQEREGFATLLFDNDFQFPVEGKSDSKLWEMLEVVREIKDRYFVDLTTERMRATFDA